MPVGDFINTFAKKILMTYLDYTDSDFFGHIDSEERDEAKQKKDRTFQDYVRSFS